jgi:hypothetical protein
VATLTALFESQGWPYRFCGFGKAITSPYYSGKGKWFYMPESMETKIIIPQEGQQRLIGLDNLDVKIQGKFFGHKVEERAKKSLVEVDWMELGQRLKDAGKTAAYVTGGVLALAGAGLVSLMTIPITFVDPTLIIVLNDPPSYTRVRIYSWYTKE